MAERIQLRDYCRRQEDPALLRQWDEKRNAPLTPDNESYGSNRAVWWTCDRGHTWLVAVKERTQGKGCPVCAGKHVQAGVNDMATLFPELASEWDAEKNGTLTPSELTAYSHRKVWWRCAEGHSWQSSAAVRTRDGAGCPVCAGRVVHAGENDLASHDPQIAAEWAQEQNGALTPEMVTPNSNRKVWWTCPRGHPYFASIAKRTKQGSGCPYCAGRKVLQGFNDLATREPQIASQWHPSLNGELSPGQVTAGSSKKAWWLCQDGHVWKAVISSRTGPQHCGCPVCAGVTKKRRAQETSKFGLD